MNTQNLYKKFDEATTWNGILFLFNKISKTFLTCFLFSKLTTTDFSLWANIYSFIYIALLWLDFGFSRSLPQYCLEFAKNNYVKNKFLKSIILFKIITSIIAGGVFYIITPKLLILLGLPSDNNLLRLGYLLFILEGTKAAIKLIFYSYFWQKQFNFIEAILISVKSIIIISLIRPLDDSNMIIQYIFWSDIIVSGILIAISSAMMQPLKTDKNYQGQSSINSKKTSHNFITHSLVMWSLISINSLTERNFLIPFITYSLNPHLANVFKVANDAALLFQRFIIKTIGTTGTSLFAHVESNQVKTTTKKVFDKLTHKIILLISVLLGLILLAYLQLEGLSEIHETFFLLTGLYLLQILFMAYERILEVKRNYKELFISFIPYFFVAPLLVLYNFITFQNLTIFLLLIHSLRTASLLIRIFFTKKLYNVEFPIKLLMKYSSFSALGALCINVLLKFSSPSFYKNIFHFFVKI